MRTRVTIPAEQDTRQPDWLELKPYPRNLILSKLTCSIPPPSDSSSSTPTTTFDIQSPGDGEFNLFKIKFHCSHAMRHLYLSLLSKGVQRRLHTTVLNFIKIKFHCSCPTSVSNLSFNSTSTFAERLPKSAIPQVPTVLNFIKIKSLHPSLRFVTLVDTISSHQVLPHNSHRHRHLSRKFNLIKINSPPPPDQHPQRSSIPNPNCANHLHNTQF